MRYIGQHRIYAWTETRKFETKGFAYTKNSWGYDDHIGPSEKVCGTSGRTSGPRTQAPTFWLPMEVKKSQVASTLRKPNSWEESIRRHLQIE